MKYNHFLPVDYPVFRDAINANAGRKVSLSGKFTVLYDRQNKVLAMLRPPAINETGECLPTRYYLRRCA